jgi:hypothetical protein
MRRRNAIIAGSTIVIGVLAFAASWWYFDWGHAPVEKLPGLHGRSMGAVVAVLGEPARQSEFSMGPGRLTEFQIELYNTYPPNHPKTAGVRIKELHWDWPRYHVAVWMHLVNGEWIVLDTCRWQEGVVF